MSWINYNHLYYFWVIAQEGGLSKAAARLRLTHSTLSSQLRLLEQALGASLFERHGRRLVITPIGEEVEAYASEIFQLGNELFDRVQRKGKSHRAAFRVGVIGALPKTVTFDILSPALKLEDFGNIQVRQGRLSRLLEELTSNRLHLVLSDTPPPDGLPFRVHIHLLGETEILFYGAPRIARKYREGFPGSLEQAPCLLPSPGSGLRRALDRWLAELQLHVKIVGEFDDAGLMRVFGAHAIGLFPVRATLAKEVEDAIGASYVGRIEGLRERYYAISLEQKATHPAVAAIIESARTRLLQSSSARRKG